jgi:hypothetical protein
LGTPVNEATPADPLPDRVFFSPVLAGQTITLTAGSLLVFGPMSVTVNASAAPGLTVSGTARVFTVLPGGTLTAEFITIAKGLLHTKSI